MRSNFWIAAIWLVGCGNYSTEDVRFLAAVPTTEMLRLKVPGPPSASTSPAVSQALSACTMGSAEAWTKAQTTGDTINAGVGAVLRLIDFVRSQDPTRRASDSRIWGPFDDQKHPRREILVTLTRQVDGCAAGEAVCYVFAFQARVKGQGDYQNLLDATFQGASAERGHGNLQIHFDRIKDLNMNDNESAYGTLIIDYERTSEPRSINLSLQQPSFGLPQFDYQWRGYGDGSGSFTYAFTNSQNYTFTVAARFNAAGAGRGDVTVTGNGQNLGFQECWDASACLSWVYDPHRFTKLCAIGQDECGQPADCVQVPPPGGVSSIQ